MCFLEEADPSSSMGDLEAGGHMGNQLGGLIALDRQVDAEPNFELGASGMYGLAKLPGRHQHSP